MARRKLLKFAQFARFTNTADWKNPDVKSRVSGFLVDSKSITLELGCGRGEYTIALAQKYPRRKYLGIDYQGERLWHGAKFALENNVKNAFFIRAYIEQIEEYILPASVSLILLPFPDPYPRKGDVNKRLTSKRYLEIYKRLLSPGGRVFLKTDSRGLFEFAKEEAARCGWSVAEGSGDGLFDVTTVYEQKAEKLNRGIYSCVLFHC